MTISGSLTATGNGVVPAFHVPVFIGKHVSNRGSTVRRGEEREHSLWDGKRN
jgi:hypothetical protein